VREEKARLARRNVERWTQLVREPLQIAHALVKAAAPAFYFQLSLRQQARALLRSVEGGTKDSTAPRAE
jgi:hypothetical protein